MSVVPTGPVVETARGAIPVASLGRTLMHEHIFSLSPETLQTGWFQDLWDEDEQVDRAVRALDGVAARGIDTLVDCTVIGIGRMVGLVERIAARVGLNLIVATGLYAPTTLPLSLSVRGPGTLLGGDEPLIEFFWREIREGIDGTSIKPAFLKCALETHDVDGHLARPLRAVARVGAESGLPIQVHTDAAAQTGIPVVEVLRGYGVDLSRVVIAHSGDSNDLDYLERLLDSGAILGCDRFGLDLFNPTEKRIETLVALIERGYAKQLVISHDTASFNDAMPDEASQARFRGLLPNSHWGFITDTVLPALLARGVSQAAIDTLMVDNPRRFFSGVHA